MHIAMIGTGYVGLVSGTCLSDFGHEVVCVDKDANKIDSLRSGKIPIYEPGLERLLNTNMAAGRLSFTTDLSEAVRKAAAVFIAVGTPSRRGDGHADLSYVFAAVEEVAAHLNGHTVIVTKSTVPVGTNGRIAELLARVAPDADVDVASNPEFLREGAAIEDFMRPDRVIFGTTSPRAAAVLREIYRPLYLRETPIVETDLATAELTKYAANAFLATKITFINEIANICEAVGGDVQAVAKGIGLDNRIGSKFLHPGPGYGGSCFPKDTRALSHTAREVGRPTTIVDTVIEANDFTKRRMVDKILALLDGDARGKTVAVLGVTFKPNTDDMREAPALTILPALADMGASIRICDPVGRREGESMLPPATWVDTPADAAEGADVLVLLTEWNAFRALDLPRLAGAMRSPRMADLRNVYDPAVVLESGFERYDGVGRGHLAPASTGPD